MIKWFKKHFIPHDGNDHQPHFLRTKNVQLLILAIFVIQLGVLVLPFISQFSPAKNFMASVLPAVLDDLTNKNRQNAHLATLTVSPELNRVAELKAQDMANKSYFAHVSPEGKNPWYWFDRVGYKYEYAGENLAVDFTDSVDVAIAWMNSPTHKANIVKNAYTEIGTGVATGTYQGNPTIFVAQVFAKPALVPVSAPVSASASVSASAPAKLNGSSVLNGGEKVTTEASSTRVLGATVSSANSKGVGRTASSTASGTASSVFAIASSSPDGSSSLVVSSLDSTPGKPYKKAGLFAKFASSPRRISNIILSILGILVLLAIGFKLFIRMDKKHPILITNGLIVLILIFTVYVTDNYIAQNKMESNTSFMNFDASNSK